VVSVSPCAYTNVDIVYHGALEWYDTQVMLLVNNLLLVALVS
jgi:hypothetical protein